MSVRLLFNSFTPRFLAPVSTTTDRTVALRFSKAEGVVLELVAVAGKRNRYFNVEWLSDYEHERERLFVRATGLRIMDINIFERGDILSTEPYMRCFLLWSSLFSGHFVAKLLKKKTQRMLLALIRNYKEHNGINDNA